MSPPRTGRAMLAWAALVAAAFAWFGSQQVGANLSFADCSAGGGPVVLLIGILALALCAAGALLSRRVWVSAAEPEGRRFVALIGLLTAALLAFTILLQTLAGLIIPKCFG